MASTELDLPDDSPDLTDEVPTLAATAAAKRGRLPIGSISPSSKPAEAGNRDEVIGKRAVLLDKEERLDTLLHAAVTRDDEELLATQLHAAVTQDEQVVTRVEQVADHDRSVQVDERVRGADPSHQVASERLEMICRQQRAWPELVEVLLERSEMLDNAEQQGQLLREVAQIYERELGDRESAFYVLQAAFNRDHAHEQTGKELERLAAATNLWQELVDEHTKRVSELEGEDRRAAADLWVKIGRWYRDHLAHRDHAIQSMQQALRLDPAHAGALAEIATLQRQHGSWSELSETLRRQAASEPSPKKQAELYVQLGGLLEQQAQDVGGAIAAYQKVLDLESQNLVALRALEALYEKTAQHDKYLAVLEALLEVSPADAERISIYERVAETWHEQFGELDRAAGAYEQIIAIDPRNHAAYHLLARLYRELDNHEALVETYRKHIAATTDAAARIALHLAMGEVYATHLQDSDRAIAAYNAVLSLDATEVHALDALGDLYEQLGEWEHTVHVLGLLVETSDDARKPELWWRIGRIQYKELGDASASEASLLRGLALGPGHLPSLEALAEQYSHRGDWLKAAQMMTRAAMHTRAAVDKVPLLCDAANIHLYELRAVDQAKTLYAEAIALDPEHVDAGRALAGLYFEAGQWMELSPVIDMLCRKAGQLRADPEQLHELRYRAARCAHSLGEHHKALGYYQASHALDATHLPTLVGHADLLFEMQAWDNAATVYQTILETILAQHRDGQREAEVVHVYYRLGMVRQALGERKQALHMFAKALELDPHHRATLQTLIDLQTQLGDWEAVIRAKRGLAATSDEREKAKLLEELGALHRDRLDNAPKAAAAYLEALELAPEARQLLQKLLDLYIETTQWPKAVETIERFVALETDPFRKGVYFHAAATLCRDELSSLDEAVDYYARALDSFFAQPERLDEQLLSRALLSFRAIDAILTGKRDWKAQERAYRDMIKRLPNDNPRFHKLKIGLIDALGEIYRSRLKQYEEATRAFEIAQQMDPENALPHNGTDRAEILAELYLVAGADHADKAVEQHTRMLRREPFKYDSYKALAQIYRDTQQYDKYWGLCSTLAFLGKADADEHQFHEQYKPRGLVKAKHAMSTDSWAKLAHSHENRYISAILGACWQGVATMNAFPHKDFGVKREDRRQLQNDELMFSKVFMYIAQALNVPLPEVYLIDDNKAADIQLANTIEKNELCPSFVVRQHLLQGKTERELAFLSARRLTYMRPEYYLRMLLPTNAELKIALLSAIVMLQPRFPVPPNMVATVQQYVPKMQKRMPPHALEQLGVIVQRFLQDTTEIDMATWGHAVDAASHRAGLVTCGDVGVSARMIAVEPVVVGGPSTKDKVKELVLFSISKEYFVIRAQMGLTIAG